jgi:protein MpaA
MLTRLLKLAGTAAVAFAASAAHAKSAPTLTPKNDIGQFCQQVGIRLHSVEATACRDSGLVPTGARSRNGLPILIRRFNPTSSVTNAAAPAALAAAVAPTRILLMGGMHGDELTASAIVFQWIQLIANGEARNFQWEVVPIVNPDGLLAPKPSRVNAGGVDLNRNFPTPNWAVEAPRYWAKETGSDPRRFPGKSALSEPESRWVNDELRRFKPDVIISVHAPYGLLDFDGPAPAPKNFGRLTLNPVGVYPGSLGNYSGKLNNVPVITIELPNAMSMPTDAEAKKIWTDMLRWITQHSEKKAVVIN